MKKILITILALIAFTPFAHADIAFVQSTSTPQLNQVSQKTVPGISTTAGNILIACVHTGKVGTTITMGDDQGGTWNLITTAVASGTSPTTMAIFYRANLTGGNVIASSTESGPAAQTALYVQEYSGVSTSNPIDTFIMASATSSLVSSGIMKTQGKTELMYQCSGNIGVVSTFTAINSFTRREKPAGGRAWITDLISASSTPTGMGTLNTSTNWQTIMVSFLPQPIGSGRIFWASALFRAGMIFW